MAQSRCCFLFSFVMMAYTTITAPAPASPGPGPRRRLARVPDFQVSVTVAPPARLATAWPSVRPGPLQSLRRSGVSNSESRARAEIMIESEGITSVTVVMVTVVRRPCPAAARAEPARISGLEIPAPNNTCILPPRRRLGHVDAAAASSFLLSSLCGMSSSEIRLG